MLCYTIYWHKHLFLNSLSQKTYSQKNTKRRKGRKKRRFDEKGKLSEDPSHIR